MEASRILSTDVHSLLVKRQRHMAAVGRTLELRDPIAVGRTPRDAVLGRPDAQPRRTLVPDWIGPALGPELLGRQTNDQRLVGLRDIFRPGALFVIGYRVAGCAHAARPSA